VFSARQRLGNFIRFYKQPSAVDALREGAEGRKLDELVREALKLLRG